VSTALSAPQQYPVASPQQDPGPDWKHQLTERLDAYRAKHPETISPPSNTNTFADSRASRIARSVASRYAAAPTYSELLLAAAQAEQAAAEAQAALAEREAQDARAAQEKIAQEQIAARLCNAKLDDVDLADQNSIQPSPEPLSSTDAEQAERHDSIRTQPATPVMPQFAARTREMHLHQTAPEPEPSLEDLWASALVEPRSLLPSKLIEFPRELVSSRRARPRLPENPAQETSLAAQQPEPAQLRIFEVQPETEPDNCAETTAREQMGTAASDNLPLSVEAAAPSKSENAPRDIFQNPIQDISHTPAPAAAKNMQHTAMNRIGVDTAARTTAFTSASPLSSMRREPNTSTARAFKGLEWAAISLDKEPTVAARRPETSVADYIPFLVDPASIDRRLMAFAVDFAAVTAGFLAFLLVFVASTPHLPAGLTAIALAGAVYASLWVLYQMLFFSLSGATAGMLYARIALCTFDDQNPSRPALRKRLAAWWLSCLPLGIGFLWCFVDEDNLSWHDRMTRMYQRGY
jgi:uncharacterized RDD family membrane protein YckC